MDTVYRNATLALPADVAAGLREADARELSRLICVAWQYEKSLRALEQDRLVMFSCERCKWSWFALPANTKCKCGEHAKRVIKFPAGTPV